MKNINPFLVIIFLISLSLTIPAINGREIEEFVFENDRISITYLVGSKNIEVDVVAGSLLLNISKLNLKFNSSDLIYNNLSIDDFAIISLNSRGYYRFDIISDETTQIILRNNGLSTNHFLTIITFLILNVIYIIFRTKYYSTYEYQYL